MEKMSKNQNVDIWMQNVVIWIQASKRVKTGRIFVFIGLFGKAGMAAGNLKWNGLVPAGSFDERASTSAWNVSRQGLRVFPGYKAEVEVVAETNGLVPVFLEVLLNPTTSQPLFRASAELDRKSIVTDGNSRMLQQEAAAMALISADHPCTYIAQSV